MPIVVGNLLKENMYDLYHHTHRMEDIIGGGSGPIPEEVTQKIINDLHIETNKIYGVLKISSDYSDEYILYCKVNGRITENRIYTKKDLYV